MKHVLGAVTIGQSPRPDVLEPMARVWGGDLQVRERGALDGLSEEEIAALQPEGGGEALVTRLSDGREVVIDHHRTGELVAGAARHLAAEGCPTVLVLCTGEFDFRIPGVRLVFPRRVLTGLVCALHDEGALGVLVPHRSQEETVGGCWKREGLEVVTETASPYAFADDEALFTRRADSLRRAGAAMIVMDCMGYTPEMRRAVVDAVGLPVVLASSAAAHAVACAFSPDLS